MKFEEPYADHVKGELLTPARQTHRATSALGQKRTSHEVRVMSYYYEISCWPPSMSCSHTSRTSPIGRAPQPTQSYLPFIGHINGTLQLDSGPDLGCAPSPTTPRLGRFAALYGR
jgi:hypothetical protein